MSIRYFVWIALKHIQARWRILGMVERRVQGHRDVCRSFIATSHCEWRATCFTILGILCYQPITNAFVSTPHFPRASRENVRFIHEASGNLPRKLVTARTFALPNVLIHILNFLKNASNMVWGILWGYTVGRNSSKHSSHFVKKHT